MKVANLHDLFVHTLQDLYYAEKKIIKSLPKMIRATDSKALAKAFTSHLEETKKQVTRLESVFKLLDEKAKGEQCPAIDGIIEEAEDLIKQIKDPDTRDAAMIAAAQAVEHYEITRYGTLVSWAQLLKQPKAAGLLQRTLDEEYAADQKLTDIAETRLNAEATA